MKLSVTFRRTGDNGETQYERTETWDCTSDVADAIEARLGEAVQAAYVKMQDDKNAAKGRGKR